MGTKTEVTSILAVKVRPRCPRCRRASVVRSSKAAATRGNGETLWELIEECIMRGCGWVSKVPYVKMGA